MTGGKDMLDGGEAGSNSSRRGAAARRHAGGGGWTIIPVSLGLGLIACCVLIPQADENRKLAHQREQLRIDLEHLQAQAKVNDEFVRRVGSDPTLAERLAQRQMKFVRKGAGVLELDEEQDGKVSSPFLLTTVPPPGPAPAYEPRGGKLSAWCRDTHTRLYMIGSGLMLLALGLVMGYAPASE